MSEPHSPQLMGHPEPKRNVKVKWHFIAKGLNFPNTVKCAFFSAVHRIFCNEDHMIGHKTSLSKYEKIDITSCLLSDHNGIDWKSTGSRTRSHQ